jgi:hypothetical protein
MPALGVAVGPPPLRSPEQDEVTTQLQGLHQLHIQLETAIAFLEGREPHGVPLFEGEIQEFISNIHFSKNEISPTATAAAVTTTTATSDATPPLRQSAEEAQQQFMELMAQISEIQRNFGKLKLQQQPLEAKNDNGSSSDDESVEDAGDVKLLELKQRKICNSSPPSFSASSSSASPNEDSYSITSTEDDESEWKEKENSNHLSGVKLLMHQSIETGRESSNESEMQSSRSSEDTTTAAGPPSTKAPIPDEKEEEVVTTQGEECSPSHSTATLRLQLIQSKRQLESRGREIARLQGVVKSLETKVVSAAAPKAVIAQAAEMQKKYADLEIQLRNAELDASEAKSQVTVLRKAAKEREKQFAEMKKPSELAVEQWQEGKKLQKRIEFLQNKLQEKSKETEGANKAQEMLQSQVNRLKNELSQSTATNRSLLAKLEKQELKYNGGPDGKKSVPVTVVQKVLEDMESLQQRHDALERQVAATQSMGKQPAANFYSSFSAPVSPAVNSSSNTQNYCPSRYTDSKSTTHGSGEVERGTNGSGSIARDLKILDLELERDQAAARATRLQERLHFVLQELGETNTDSTEAKASPYLTSSRQDQHQLNRRRSSSSSSSTAFAKKSKEGGSEREKELLDTISLLKSALERTRKGLENGVSSAKYMQAIEKAKHAAERVRELEVTLKEAEMQQERINIAQREAADAHVMISALRGQLRDAKRRGKENAAARNEIMIAQIAELERALRERDGQLAALKHSACDEARALVAEGLTPKMVVYELLSAREQLAAALEREEAMKRELAPFDAVFFFELHQLKREHEELRAMCASYQNNRTA